MDADHSGRFGAQAKGTETALRRARSTAPAPALSIGSSGKGRPSEPE